MSKIKLIKGIEVKNLLTEDELKECEKIGLINDSCWVGATLTGSRAFGTHREDSDIDIFFPADDILYSFTNYNHPHAEKLPEGWIHKNLILDENNHYAETNINIVNGRLNLFTLDTEGCDYHQMYCDATLICMAGRGNKEIFKKFCALMTEKEVYL